MSNNNNDTFNFMGGITSSSSGIEILPIDTKNYVYDKLVKAGLIKSSASYYFEHKKNIEQYLKLVDPEGAPFVEELYQAGSVFKLTNDIMLKLAELLKRISGESALNLQDKKVFSDFLSWIKIVQMENKDDSGLINFLVNYDVKVLAAVANLLKMESLLLEINEREKNESGTF